MDTNIKIVWGELKSNASQVWMDRIGSILKPALEERGFTIGSVYAIDPAPGNEFIAVWVCTKGDYYMEIQAHSANAFSVIGNDGGKTFNWPTLPASVYDRKNYTIGYLLEWIDQQIV